MRIDKEFVLKKLGFSLDEFDTYIKTAAVPHTNYKVSGSLTKDYPIIKIIKPIYKKLKGIK